MNRDVDRLWVEDEISKFDPSDDYHVLHPGEDALDARAYYAAIDRVSAFLRGSIKDWTSPR